jgi:hypothetical protein
LRHTWIITLLPGLLAADDAWQVAGIDDGLAVELQDHIAGLDARLLRRAALLDGVDRCALRLLKPKDSASSLLTSWMTTRCDRG